MLKIIVSCVNESIDISGYQYSFPFLKNDTGISVKDNYVHPLYKQILNIRFPSMAFIGIPYVAAHNPMYDLQVTIPQYLKLQGSLEDI